MSSNMRITQVDNMKLTLLFGADSGTSGRIWIRSYLCTWYLFGIKESGPNGNKGDSQRVQIAVPHRIGPQVFRKCKAYPNQFSIQIGLDPII